MLLFEIMQVGTLVESLAGTAGDLVLIATKQAFDVRYLMLQQISAPPIAVSVQRIAQTIQCGLFPERGLSFLV